MAKPVTNLTLHIEDNGDVILSAGDAEDRHITIQQLRDVAVVLGPDAVSGVESRLAMIRSRLQGQADARAAAVARAEEAQRRLAALDEAMSPSS